MLGIHNITECVHKAINSITISIKDNANAAVKQLGESATSIKEVLKQFPTTLNRSCGTVKSSVKQLIDSKRGPTIGDMEKTGYR